MRNLKLISQTKEGLGREGREHIWAGRKTSLEEFQKRALGSLAGICGTAFVLGHPQLLLGGNIT